MLLDDHPLRLAFPCPQCGSMIRRVECTTGGMIIINDHPDPAGNIIPWPAARVSAAAQARIMEHPIPSDTRWSEHPCPID